MSYSEVHQVTTDQARAFLTERFNSFSAPQLVGEGAWSRCFSFRRDDKDFVIRFGSYLEDFQQDELAYRYASPDLPVPKVLEIGKAFDGYYAVSERVFGEPLESLSPGEWRRVVPSVVAALEALRSAALPPHSGVGGWGTEKAPYSTWADHLLAVGEDGPHRRTHGWSKKLAAFPGGSETFAWGFELLKEVAGAAPRCLVHSDLINRNVLVKEGAVSGVFDWGCALYGDHLYDLAWFEFWSPWHPNLDVAQLRSVLERRWSDSGYAPEHKDSRLLACYLHIGLDHLAYNAHTENWPDLAATAKRMRTLVQK